jgi:hypothetical protein
MTDTGYAVGLFLMLTLLAGCSSLLPSEQKKPFPPSTITWMQKAAMPRPSLEKPPAPSFSLWALIL